MVSRALPRLTNGRDENVLVPLGPCEVGPGCRYGTATIGGLVDIGRGSSLDGVGSRCASRPSGSGECGIDMTSTFS